MCVVDTQIRLQTNKLTTPFLSASTAKEGTVHNAAVICVSLSRVTAFDTHTALM